MQRKATGICFFSDGVDKIYIRCLRFHPERGTPFPISTSHGTVKPFLTVMGGRRYTPRGRRSFFVTFVAGTLQDYRDTSSKVFCCWPPVVRYGESNKKRKRLGTKERMWHHAFRGKKSIQCRNLCQNNRIANNVFLKSFRLLHGHGPRCICGFTGQFIGFFLAEFFVFTSQCRAR